MSGIYKPRIAVITVVKDSPVLLEETIKSVISQSYENIDHVVIDGDSGEEVLAVFDKYSENISEFLSEPDSGIYDAMNKGISIARARSCEFLQFLNAGDTFSDTDSVELMVSEINPAIDLFYCGSIIVDGESRWSQPPKGFNLEELKRWGTGVVCHQALFVRSEFAPEYDTNFRFKAELNWYFDLLEVAPGLEAHRFEESLIVYRTGGYGYQNFLKNRLDGLRVVYRKFGIRDLVEYETVPQLIKGAKYRYPLMRHLTLLFWLCFKLNDLLKLALLGRKR